LEWRKGCDTLFDCKNLKKLFINKFDKKNTELFVKLGEIENITLLNSPIENLDGIYYLSYLTRLRIANLKNIQSLKGIEKLINLIELEIVKCKNIKDISNIFKLQNLKKLFILDNGVISSIKGIENITELNTFLFYESTNIADGDLMPLLKLKKLSDISYQNRKHYTHKREDFGKSYAS